MFKGILSLFPLASSWGGRKERRRRWAASTAGHSCSEGREHRPGGAKDRNRRHHRTLDLWQPKVFQMLEKLQDPAQRLEGLTAPLLSLGNLPLTVENSLFATTLRDKEKAVPRGCGYLHLENGCLKPEAAIQLACAGFKASFLCSAALLGRIKSEWPHMRYTGKPGRARARAMLGSSSPPRSLPTLDCFDSNR